LKSALGFGGEKIVRNAARALLLMMTVSLLLDPHPVAAQTAESSEAIQKRREEIERDKQEYIREKVSAENFNKRVARYVALRDSIPFLTVPGTTNLVRVYVNRHDVKQIARDLYFLTDGATEEGFRRDYWHSFLVINQADRYAEKVPEYGALSADAPDDNIAVYVNIRKRGATATIPTLSAKDSALAKQLTDPAVRAHKKRLRELVEALALEAGDPPPATGPPPPSGDTRYALFRAHQGEPQDIWPPRRITDESSMMYAFAEERSDVDINEPLSLEPAPPSWALSHGMNMLGEDYQGYDATYEPKTFQLHPEVGAMGFYGVRDALGNPTTQPGLYLAFNQKLWNILLFNETAFAAFSKDTAPAVNGGLLNVGFDYDFRYFALAGMVGIAGYNVVGETTSSLAYTGRLEIPVSPTIYIGAIWMHSEASITRGTSEVGLSSPGFIGVNLTIR
jgi:hypothetical protein